MPQVSDELREVFLPEAWGLVHQLEECLPLVSQPERFRLARQVLSDLVSSSQAACCQESEVLAMTLQDELTAVLPQDEGIWRNLMKLLSCCLTALEQGGREPIDYGEICDAIGRRPY